MAANTNELMLRDDVQNVKTTAISKAQLEGVKQGVDRVDLRNKTEALKRAQAYTFLAQLKFDEAAKVLEQMTPTQEIDSNLLVTECFLHLGREGKALKAMEEIERVLLTPPAPDVTEVVSLADNFMENSCYIRAVILLHNTASMYSKFGSSDEDKLVGIRDCIEKTSNAVGAMVKAGDRLRVIAIDYGIEYMAKMRELLRSLTWVHHEKKILEEAWCVNLVAYNHVLVDNNDKGIDLRKVGLALIEDLFGVNACKYRVYGTLLHNIGVGYFKLKKYNDAEAYYSKAVEAKGKALDYDSDEKRNEDVELSNQELMKAVQNLP